MRLARPESEPKTPLGGRLRVVRRHFGNEVRDAFAKLLGISKDALALYERGENAPTSNVLSAYHTRFGVNVHWLLTGEGEMLFDPSNAPGSASLRTIDQAVFKAVGSMVVKVHCEEGVALPPGALLDEQSSAYNTLIGRAEDPGETEELLSLLPWLEARLRKSLKAAAAAAEPGTGKRPT